MMYADKVDSTEECGFICYPHITNTRDELLALSGSSEKEVNPKWDNVTVCEVASESGYSWNRCFKTKFKISKFNSTFKVCYEGSV